jgi:hypothetical protein
MVLLVIEAMGCGDGREKVSPVRGKVTYKGQGIPQATVVFFRVDPPNEITKKLHPYAYVGNDGQFEIKTYVDGDGAPPGKYRVSIIAPAAAGTSKKDRPVETEPSSVQTVKVPAEIAAKYANVETAGIEITVQPGENVFEPFELAAAGGRGANATSSISTSSASSKN